MTSPNNSFAEIGGVGALIRAAMVSRCRQARILFLDVEDTRRLLHPTTIAKVHDETLYLAFDASPADVERALRRYDPASFADGERPIDEAYAIARLDEDGNPMTLETIVDDDCVLGSCGPCIACETDALNSAKDDQYFTELVRNWDDIRGGAE